MNDLYVHQLETENKQLRIALQECRKALEEEIKTKKEAIEYGKSCINEDLDVDKLDEEYKDIFKIAYEIHKHYLTILGDKENENIEQ